MLNRILCVDDDPITLLLYSKVINKTNFSKEIITAKNGEKALHYFDNLLKQDQSILELPELIFLDLNMPVMSGWDFLDSFKTDQYKKFHNIKVVVLSSTIDPKDIEKSQTYPMVLDFLSKPISVSMLEYLSSKIQ
ncbi:response regulator [Flavobacterium sp.]|uniref:response regulator n=1 Tax=Flavobacterium sp. TaxID=239 RepID=UPI002605044B|nr:response regulator [Flavobacterium sp.]MDG2433339.1 response regulator [Flavobacterium sp.]